MLNKHLSICIIYTHNDLERICADNELCLCVDARQLTTTGSNTIYGNTCIVTVEIQATNYRYKRDSSILQK